MDLSQVVAIAGSVGLLTPLLTALVMQPHWTNRTRTIMAVIVSVVVGTVTYLSVGLTTTSLDTPADYVALVVGIILASATAHQSLWKPSGVTDAVELATSVRPKHAELDGPEDLDHTV